MIRFCCIAALRGSANTDSVEMLQNMEGTHDEFYIDDDTLLALVIERFYQKVS